MGMEKGLYGKTCWWNEKNPVAHATPLASQNEMVFPEGDDARFVAVIKGAAAGCTGPAVFSIIGVLYGVEVVIDTLTLNANGIAEVKGEKLVNIKGFDSLKGSLTYTDVGFALAEAQMYVGVPYK